MKLTELFLEELNAEVPATRRMLERVPEGRTEWKPHPRSTTLGYLATLVATIPSWVTMSIRQDELDLNPPGKPKPVPPTLGSGRELVQAFDGAVAGAREALGSTSDDFLRTPWKLLVSGKVVLEAPRYVVIRDSAINHLAHHRGQLSVYLRLLDVPVPSIYGPTADEPGF
jgi:uncharacterized damage-inducible protein DinB